MQYLYDGTYTGWLTCVFESFERKEADAEPAIHNAPSADLFRGTRTIITDNAKAKRVYDGLCHKLTHQRAADFFRAFLSEDPQAHTAAFRIIRQVFTGNAAMLENYGDTDVLYFAQTLKKVSRERHRMKAFIRFRKSSDGLYFSVVEPDFNVLPMIARFFRDRYADQRWLIYDARRRYGLLYDLQSVSEVALTHNEKETLTAGTVSIALDEKETLYQQLWQQYFKSTSIASRKNTRLHLQHVPKRYWKYLTEKW